jgi:hypothetical protein
MYEQRFIAFIDILGFGNLVETSAKSPELVKKIIDVLISMSPEIVEASADSTPNLSKIPDERKDDVLETIKLFNEKSRLFYKVDISYFSDSLVLSAKADNAMSSQMLLEIIAKLQVTLWQEHNLLIRGGLTVGQLIHIENGPMFGPAMNRAYHLESKMAVFPRILIDEVCYQEYQKTDFRAFESLLEQDEEYRFMSLATSYRFLINDSGLAWGNADILTQYREALSQSPEQIETIMSTITDEKILKKYDWTLNDIFSRKKDINSPR